MIVKITRRFGRLLSTAVAAHVRRSANGQYLIPLLVGRGVPCGWLRSLNPLEGWNLWGMTIVNYTKSYMAIPHRLERMDPWGMKHVIPEILANMDPLEGWREKLPKGSGGRRLVEGRDIE